VSGKADEATRFDTVRNSCPGAGACGGMYTANTMASAIEALGMTLPYSSSIPAEDPLKLMECKMAGAAVLKLLKLDLKPRDIMVRVPQSCCAGTTAGKRRETFLAKRT
jgi:dihydroxy-acid dehydratase